MINHSIPQSIASVREKIATYCHRAGRPVESVKLIAVSKTKPLSMIEAAFNSGERNFGESYVQEAVSKIEVFNPPGIVWHFIGPIQSNKTKAIAEHFSWVHSVDRLSIAERLSTQRPERLPPLNMCIQVNIDEERSKSGVSLSALPDLVLAIQALPHLTLRGLMAVPKKRDSLDEQRLPFSRLRDAFEKIRAQGIVSFDTLSMGMSNDLEAAILEGATWVRIGTAIFGDRSLKHAH
jgi:pyridoxal phosphate enzyme (YggS family)